IHGTRARHRSRRLHRRVRRAGAARPRTPRDGAGQPLQVRPGRPLLRLPPALPVRGGRRPRRRAAHRAARRLPAPHRRGRDDRWHLVLPHLRLRPAGHQRAHHGGDLRRGDRGAPRRRDGEGDVPVLVDGVRVGRPLAVPGGRRAPDPAAGLLVRVPEARGRVLRPRRVRPVRAAVHDRASVQLRRGRGGAGTRPGRGAVRQRQARHVPRRARPGPEGPQGAGSAAPARRRQPGPPLHVRRRPRPRHRRRDGAPGRAQRRLQPLHSHLHHRAGAGPPHLGEDPRSGRAVPVRQRRAVPPRRRPPDPGHRQGGTGAGLPRHHPAGPDARRGDPVGRRRGGGRPAVTGATGATADGAAGGAGGGVTRGVAGGPGGGATGGVAGSEATAPPAGHGTPASHRRRRWLLAAGAVAVGSAASLARQPGTGALDTVWAEDGQIFLAGAVGRSLPRALATPYAGYLHTGPRLIAEAAALVPAQRAALVLSGAAAVVTALLALLVYAAAAGHLPPPTRVVAAAMVVAVPLAQGDLPNSVANLHWPALYALFWVLLWTPATLAGRVVAVGTTVLVALSDVLVVALLPLAVARLV